VEKRSKERLIELAVEIASTRESISAAKARLTTLEGEFESLVGTGQTALAQRSVANETERQLTLAGQSESVGDGVGERIVSLLNSCLPMSVDSDWVQERLGRTVGIQVIRTTLARLYRDGLIEKSSRGQYCGKRQSKEGAA
jgi:hypothetical protein